MFFYKDQLVGLTYLVNKICIRNSIQFGASGVGKASMLTKIHVTWD